MNRLIYILAYTVGIPNVVTVAANRPGKPLPAGQRSQYERSRPGTPTASPTYAPGSRSSSGRVIDSPALAGGYSRESYNALSQKEQREIDQFYSRNPQSPTGVYAGARGEQVTVVRGAKPKTAGEYVRGLEGGVFQPVASPYQEGKVVGVVKGENVDLGSQRLFVTRDGVTSSYSSIPTSAVYATPAPVAQQQAQPGQKGYKIRWKPTVFAEPISKAGGYLKRASLNVFENPTPTDQKILNTPLLGSAYRYSASIGFGLGGKLEKEPDRALGEVVVFGGAGKIVGSTAGLVPQTFTRFGATKVAVYSDRAITYGLGALGVYGVATTDPQVLGREAPKIVPGAIGFGKGYSTTTRSSISFARFERINPVTDPVPKFISTETNIRPTTFASVSRAKATFDVTEFGVPRQVTTDVLGVARGGRAYSRNTGRPLAGYNVKQEVSFSEFSFKGKPYRIPVSEQYGYVYGKETAFVDKRGAVSLFRQYRGVLPNEAFPVTKISSSTREYAELYKTFGIRFKPETTNRGLRVRVSGASARANVETGFGYDIFKLRRQPVIRGRGPGRVQPTGLGSRSEAFEFSTLVGSDKLLSGEVIRPARPIESRAVRRLQDRGFLSSEQFGFSGGLGRRGELVSFQPRPSEISVRRYARRSPKVQFYPDVAAPQVSSLRSVPVLALNTYGRSAFSSKQSSSILGSTSSLSVEGPSYRTSPLVDVGLLGGSRSSVISRTSQDRVPTVITEQRTIFDTGGIGAIGPGVGVPPPPFVPGMPGIPPLFGAGRGRGVEGRGRGRQFKYAPSFNAFLFGIKGKRPTGPLSGFETRPILTR